MRGNVHVPSRAGEKVETVSKPYLWLSLDQSDGLIELCEALKGWHKLVFTHYEMDSLPLTPQKKEKFLNSIDILIDGSYIAEERIYDKSKKDGFHNAVGSGNQVIWDLRKYHEHKVLFGIAARLLEGFTVDKDGSLHYNKKYHNRKE